MYLPAIVRRNTKSEPEREALASREPVPNADARVESVQRTILEGVGAEIAASFPGITRLGGQIVAALYLADSALSMDELSARLGRSKSNIFTNLRALDAAGIVERRRCAGTRYDTYALRGPYPDVIIGAYIARLRRVVADKRALTDRAMRQLGDATGHEAQSLRVRLGELHRKYELFGEVFTMLGPEIDGPLDLEAVLGAIPQSTIGTFVKLVRAALVASDAGAPNEAEETKPR